MKSLNVVALTGKALESPEIRSFSSGNEVMTLRFVWWTTKKDGDAWKENANFIDVKQWKPSRKFADLVHKGTPLAISGSLEMEEWVDKKTGVTRNKYVIVAHNICFSGPKAENEVPGSQDTLAPIDGGKVTLSEGEETPF